MAQKSWHLSRRKMLFGTGASLALPWMQCMTRAASVKASIPPTRFCSMYFGFGVSLPDAKGEHAQWRWFPEQEGADYELNSTLHPLECRRDDVTVLGGLSHPNGRRMGAHDTGDTFLTGAFLNNKYLQNTISLDQILAEQTREQVRFPSLVLSTDGGVGEPTRSSTLSYDSKGRPIPALNQPQQVYERFFGKGDVDTLVRRRQLGSTKKMLDLVLDDSKNLQRLLGSSDRRVLEEYLDSVRKVERDVELSQSWLDKPRPELTDNELLELDLESNEQAPHRFIETMYGLLFLAFRTDSTRVATYQITNMADASSKAGKFPQLQGFKKSLHSLAHDWNKPGGAEALGKWDRFMIERLANFLEQLACVEDENARLLDNTIVLYGSSNSNTHNNNNYPLILAGGSNVGFKHGSYRRFANDVPMSNLLLTIANRFPQELEQFADSTGEISELMGA